MSGSGEGGRREIPTGPADLWTTSVTGGDGAAPPPEPHRLDRGPLPRVWEDGGLAHRAGPPPAGASSPGQKPPALENMPGGGMG